MSKLDKVQKYVDKSKEAGLIKLANDKDKEVRLAAIAGMGKIGKDDSFNVLISMMADPDPDIRAADAAALGAMKNEHADAHLRHRLELESDARVTQAIKDALLNIRKNSHA